MVQHLPTKGKHLPAGVTAPVSNDIQPISHVTAFIGNRVGRGHHFFITAMDSGSFHMLSNTLIMNMTSKTQV